MSTKVFVGNLSFKIAPEKLREEFSAAGTVLTANIITRGPRSLGYGFVEFASREDAEKSVTLLNHKAIDGREINVEVAKPRTDLPEREKRPDNQDGQSQGGQRPPRRTRRPRNENSNTTTTTTTTTNNPGQGGPRGPRRPQQQQDAPPRRMYKPRYPNQDNAGGNLANEGQGNSTGRPFNNNNNFNTNNHITNDGGNGGPNRRPRRRRNNPDRGGAQQDMPPQQPSQGQQQPQFRRKRPAPQPKKQQERISSPTTLFVANLPFSVDDKELAEIFSTKWKVVKAHVVKKRNTRSKGFGFVEFENEPDQQAALKDFDGFTLHERVLNVKVALTALPGEEENEEGEQPAAEGGEKPAQVEEKAAAEPKVEAKEAKVEAAAADGAAAEEKKGGQ